VGVPIMARRRRLRITRGPAAVRTLPLALVLGAVLTVAPLSAQTLGHEIADGTPMVTDIAAEPPAAPDNGAVPYAAEIRMAATRWGLPEELVTAIIRIESNFDARATSRKGAQGLMQLMPQTASLLGVTNAFDPAQNIEGGVRHLRGLLDRFANSLLLALAAYHAGERAVMLYRDVPPFQETRAYVARVLGLLRRPDEPAAETVAMRPSLYRTVRPDGTLVYGNRLPPAAR
jgi:soluble lytic murein transglycosylase-like protein